MDERFSSTHATSLSHKEYDWLPHWWRVGVDQGSYSSLPYYYSQCRHLLYDMMIVSWSCPGWIPCWSLSFPWWNPIVPWRSLSFPWWNPIVPWWSLSFPWWSPIVPWWSLSFPWWNPIVPCWSLSFPWWNLVVPWWSLIVPWYDLPRSITFNIGSLTRRLLI